MSADAVIDTLHRLRAMQVAAGASIPAELVAQPPSAADLEHIRVCIGRVPEELEHFLTWYDGLRDDGVPCGPEHGIAMFGPSTIWREVRQSPLPLFHAENDTWLEVSTIEGSELCRVHVGDDSSVHPVVADSLDHLFRLWIRLLETGLRCEDGWWQVTEWGQEGYDRLGSDTDAVQAAAFGVLPPEAWAH